ncbi:hypothetical protein FVER53590_30334 [Fusarium verticillioides]|nr:hypothetical protein FVER53590_30334 [Fusarium verticillioides]
MELFELPGFGLPVNYMPEDDRHFPILLGTGSDFVANTLTNRELCIVRIISEFTNKPDWWIKVLDGTIASRWKTESLKFDQGQYLRYGDFTTAMADACIEEMKLKVTIYQKTKLLPVYDYIAAIVKSDHLIPEDTWQALKQGVEILEDVPAAGEDRHPGRDGKVLKLVHPSMYPLIESYINNLHPTEHAALYPIIEKFIEEALPAWDIVYRWLEEFPTQRLTTEEARVRCRSRRTCANTSEHVYTALARPTQDGEPHRGQYDKDYSDSVISDQGVSNSDDNASLKVSYQWGEPERTLNATLQRFPKKTDQSDSEYETEEYDSSEDSDIPDSESEYEDGEQEERDLKHVSKKEVKRRELRWFYKTHPVVAPEPSPQHELKFCAEDVKSMGIFHSTLPETGPKRLQVIVKLANIHLTQENPNYPFGSWHTEGQMNEQICSTALL